MYASNVLILFSFMKNDPFPLTAPDNVLNRLSISSDTPERFSLPTTNISTKSILLKMKI